MGHAEVDQASFFTAGNHLDLMAENFLGAADEHRAVARLTQGIGADDAYSAFRQCVGELGETTQAVESALHRFFAELALVVQARGQLHFVAEALEDANFVTVGLGQHHVKAVRTQVDGSDQGETFGRGFGHDYGISFDFRAIVPRLSA